MEGLAKVAALYSKGPSLHWDDIPWPTKEHGVEDLHHFQVEMDRPLYLMRKRFGKSDAAQGGPEGWSDYYKETRPNMLQNDMDKMIKTYKNYGIKRPLGQVHPQHHLDDSSPFRTK